MYSKVSRLELNRLPVDVSCNALLEAHEPEAECNLVLHLRRRTGTTVLENLNQTGIEQK